MLLLTDFGSHRFPKVLGTPRSTYVQLVKTHSFGLFPPVFYAISHWFWVPVWSDCFGNPWVRLRGTRQNSQFWPILGSFVCYYSLILDPAVIRTFSEPQDSLTWNSSKLAVLAYSGRFSMLISHWFWVLVWSERFGNPGVWLRGTRQNSQFWPILARILRLVTVLGHPVIQTFRKPRGLVTWNSSKLKVLVYFG